MINKLLHSKKYTLDIRTMTIRVLNPVETWEREGPRLENDAYYAYNRNQRKYITVITRLSKHKKLEPGDTVHINDFTDF